VKLPKPQLKGPQIRAPKFLTDVARDLRDRHLLIPVVALLVAIVAVPVLLKSSAEPAPPPPPAADALDGAATQPAVLAESVTGRDYRERLAELKSKNPFRQAFTAPKIGDDQGIAEVADSLDTGAAPAPTDASDAGTATDTSTGTSTSTSSSSDSGGDNSSSQHPTIRFYTYRIDVSVGPQGDLKERNGVDQLTLLPSSSKPVVAFLGITGSGRQAVFSVSDDVSATSGEGSCAPSPSTCHYLTLRTGQSRTFDYTPNGLTYRLKLRDIRVVRLDKAPGVSAK
jgi:hypothetical protein